MRTTTPGGAETTLGRDRLTPLVLGGTAAAGLVVVATRDPNVGGSYGFCPFKALTGWDCPFCGGLRGTYALMHGDVATALDHNLLIPFVLAGFVGLVWATWRRWNWQTVSSERIRRAVVVVAVFALVAFWVVRNVPGMLYLNSAA